MSTIMRNVVKHKNNEKSYVHNIFTILLKQILMKIKGTHFQIEWQKLRKESLGAYIENRNTRS